MICVTVLNVMSTCWMTFQRDKTKGNLPVQKLNIHLEGKDSTWSVEDRWTKIPWESIYLAVENLEQRELLGLTGKKLFFLK